MASVSSAGVLTSGSGWRGGVWRGGGYGGGDTPATGTRIARAAAATVPPRCWSSPPRRHHPQPHLRWPTLCILTPSSHLKFHFKLNPHYTTSRLHEGWWSSPSTQHTCSQAPVNTLLSVQKYDVCVGELNYWYLERCKDAEQRGHWGHEPGRQLKLKSSSDDRLMPGPSWGDVRRFWTRTRVARLTTNYYTQSHSHNEYRAKKYFRSEKYLILGRARSPKNEG